MGKNDISSIVIKNDSHEYGDDIGIGKEINYADPIQEKFMHHLSKRLFKRVLYDMLKCSKIK